MNSILQVFYSVFSGVLISIGIPNELFLLGFYPVAFVALIPYIYAIKNAKNYWVALLLGFIQACTTHVCSSFWLANFKNFAALTLGASAFGTAVQGAYFAVLAYLPYADKKNRSYIYTQSIENCPKISFRIFYFASLYTIYEYFKSIGFLGYPWGTISTCMFNFTTFKQIAAITGTYGMTFLTALFNALVVELFELTVKNPDFDILEIKPKTTSQKNNWFYFGNTAAVFGVLMATSLIYGVYQCNKVRKPQKIVTTIVVQQNRDSWEDKNNDEHCILNSQKLTEEQFKILKEQDNKPDVILWCEGTLKYMFPNSLNHYKNYPDEKPLTKFIKEYKTPLITGGSYKKDPEKGIYYNVAHLFDEYGNYRGYYGKNHLVPFAESIPGMEYPKIRAFMSKIIGISSGWFPGDQYVTFEVPCKYGPEIKLPAEKNIDITIPYSKQQEIDKKKPTVKISTPICYDDAFPDVIRPMFFAGTELFMNITDDSWSLKQSSEYQHFVVSSFRAIEYRTTFVRSTNAGYSVILDPTGTILKDLPLFERAAMSYDVPVFEREMTTYARFGNWLPVVLIIFVIISWIYIYFHFTPDDYIKSERVLKKKGKKHHKKKK